MKKYYLLFTILIICVSLTHKLTHSPIWFDEAVEYWYSKLLIGSATGIGFEFMQPTQNMYDRICLTFQPPLYNFLTHFWLLFFDTEFGFRFFGVFVILIGAVGFYLLVFEFSRSEIFSSIATILFATQYRIAYYAQECSEYFFLISFVIWMNYFFMISLEKFDDKQRKFLIGFCICSILAIYSQYGCSFVVFGESILILFKLRGMKNFYFTLKLFALGTVSILILVQTFLIKQFRAMEFFSGNNDHSPEFFLNPVADFFQSIGKTIDYLFFRMSLIDFEIGIGIFFISLLIATYFLLRKKFLNNLIESAGLTWLVYYIAVKFKFYAYQNYEQGFGLRWDLIFAPIFSLIIIAIIFELLNRSSKSSLIKKIFSIIAVILFLINLHAIDRNWVKSTDREIVEFWLTQNISEIPSVIHPWTSSTFQFYLQHSKKYEVSLQKNILNFDIEGRTALEKLRSDNQKFSFELIFEKVFELYKFPNEFFYIGTRDDLFTHCIFDFLHEHGYREKKIFDGTTSIWLVNK